MRPTLPEFFPLITPTTMCRCSQAKAGRSKSSIRPPRRMGLRNWPCEDGISRGKLYRFPKTDTLPRVCQLAEASTVPDLASGFLEKIVDMLAGLRLESSLGFDPVRNLNCGSQTYFRIKFKPPAQIRLDQHKFIRGCVRRSGGRRTEFRSRIPRRPHFLRRLLMHHHRSSNKIAQPAALPVAHHTHQTHT